MMFGYQAAAMVKDENSSIWYSSSIDSAKYLESVVLMVGRDVHGGPFNALI